jgi:hypothetical protein
VCSVHQKQRPGGTCRRRAGGSGYTSRKGGIGRTSGGEAAAARLGEGSSAPRLAGLATEHRDLEAAVHRSWQAQRSSGAPRRRPRATPRRASDHALEDGKRAGKSDRKRNEWIGISG